MIIVMTTKIAIITTLKNYDNNTDHDDAANVKIFV